MSHAPTPASHISRRKLIIACGEAAMEFSLARVGHITSSWAPHAGTFHTIK